MSEQGSIVRTPALIGDEPEDEIIYWIDLLVQDLVVVEIINAEQFNPIFEAQVLTYLKMIGEKAGLPTNLTIRLVRDGIRRFIL